MIPNLIKFIKLLYRFQSVERTLKVLGQERFENDSEHSYHLAMTAWYLIDAEKLDLDKNTVLKYALVHDFPEVYAGDTYIYTTDQNLKENKHEREAEAMQQLAEELPEFSDMHEYMRRYEARADEEAKFVYALDKLLPVIEGYIDEGKNWSRLNIDLQLIIDTKTEKIAVYPHLIGHFDEMVRILRENEKRIFANNDS